MSEHLGGAVARALGLGTLLLSGCLGGGGGGGGSGLGESCERTRDCEDDLVCVNLTCVGGAASDAAGGAGGGAGGFGGFGGFGGGAGGEGGAGGGGGVGNAGGEGGEGGAGNEGGAGGGGGAGGDGGAGNAGGEGGVGGAGGGGGQGGQGGAGNEGGQGGAGNEGGQGGGGGGVPSCGGRDRSCAADQYCDPVTDTCLDGCRIGEACTTQDSEHGVCADPARVCEPLRACCLPGFECAETVAAECARAGGTSVADAATCAEALRCFEPTVRSFEGIREDVAVAELEAEGFVRCHRSLHSATSNLGALLGVCDGDVLLLGCAPADADRLTVAAMGLRADVLRDVGSERFGSHVHNGTQWYFNGQSSIGFAPVGAEIDRNTCDYLGLPGYDNVPRTDAHQRMCWHTNQDRLEVGFRCGLAHSSDFGFDTGYVRVIYQRAGRLN